MNILFEFFDTEQIENVYTCLNHDVDKVYYFGYHEKMTVEKKNAIKELLRSKCHLTDVSFYEVSSTDFSDIMSRIEGIIVKERDIVTENGQTIVKKPENNIVIDLTGGQDLVLAAMGIVSEKYELPMFQYRIKSGRLICVNMGDKTLSDYFKENKRKLSISEYISLYCNGVNLNKVKDYKDNLADSDFKDDIMKMYEIMIKDPKKWNRVSTILRDFNKYYSKETSELIIPNSLLNSKINGCGEINGRADFDKFMKELKAKGLLVGYIENSASKTIIKFKNNKIKENIWDSGSVLELKTYYDYFDSHSYDDCKIGMFIDWDGIIHTTGDDVENEVDVVAISGNIPTLISCKNKGIDKSVFYELDTVAERLGNKYVKKEVVTTIAVDSCDMQRAEEMGIKVTVLTP